MQCSEKCNDAKKYNIIINENIQYKLQEFQYNNDFQNVWIQSQTKANKCMNR